MIALSGAGFSTFFVVSCADTSFTGLLILTGLVICVSIFLDVPNVCKIVDILSLLSNLVNVGVDCICKFLFGKWNLTLSHIISFDFL